MSTPSPQVERVQVGWWFPDRYQPERMSRAEWEHERLVSMWTMEDEGGFAGEWPDRALPVFVELIRGGKP